MFLLNCEYLDVNVGLCTEGISSESVTSEQVNDELFQDLIVPYMYAFNSLCYVELML